MGNYAIRIWGASCRPTGLSLLIYLILTYLVIYQKLSDFMTGFVHCIIVSPMLLSCVRMYQVC